MQAIVKHTLIFRHPAKPNIKHRAMLSLDVQTLPDWVKLTPEFKSLVETKNIIEFVPEPVPVTVAPVAKPSQKPSAKGTDGKESDDKK